jgi:mRNA interferase MazF
MVAGQRASSRETKKEAMKRGEIYLVEMDPVRRGELGKTRPCVVVSDEDYNRHAPTVLVMPITSYPPTIRSPSIRATARTGLDHDSSVLPLHIRAVAKNRLTRRLGRASDQLIREAIGILITIVGE